MRFKEGGKGPFKFDLTFSFLALPFLRNFAILATAF